MIIEGKTTNLKAEIVAVYKNIYPGNYGKRFSVSFIYMDNDRQRTMWKDFDNRENAITYITEIEKLIKRGNKMNSGNNRMEYGNITIIKNPLNKWWLVMDKATGPGNDFFVTLADAKRVIEFAKNKRDKKGDKTMTKKELIQEYNSLCDRESVKPNRLGSQALHDLTDRELFVFIAAKSLEFGRSFVKAIENADLHMKNREKAEKCFCQKNHDLLGL